MSNAKTAETQASAVPHFFPGAPSTAVIHIELDRMRRHLETLHLLHLQLEIGVDLIVGEDVAPLQEGAVRIEMERRALLGMNPLLPASLVAWVPTEPASRGG